MPRSSLDELHVALSNTQHHLKQRHKTTGSPYSTSRAGSMSRAWLHREMQQLSPTDYQDGNASPSPNSLAAVTKTMPRVLTTIGSRAVASCQKRSSSSRLQPLLSSATTAQSSSSEGCKRAEKACSACIARREDCLVETGTRRRQCKGCQRRKVKCDHTSAPTAHVPSLPVSKSGDVEDVEDDNSQNSKSSDGSNVSTTVAGTQISALLLPSTRPETAASATTSNDQNTLLPTSASSRVLTGTATLQPSPPAPILSESMPEVKFTYKIDPKMYKSIRQHIDVEKETGFLCIESTMVRWAGPSEPSTTSVTLPTIV